MVRFLKTARPSPAQPSWRAWICNGGEEKKSLSKVSELGDLAKGGSVIGAMTPSNIKDIGRRRSE